MVRINQIKLRSSEPAELLPEKTERLLRLSRGSIAEYRIVKESIDARDKPDIFKVYSLDIHVDHLSDEALLAKARRVDPTARIATEDAYTIEPLQNVDCRRPVVVGFGPCGMFAALALAMMGLKPIVLERGPAMDERIRAVDAFWAGGPLDRNANVQFGEGGAGTFSDGKLTTGTRDRAAGFILSVFANAGADKDILYKQKAHIGTDVIRVAVVNIRKRIEALGGEVRFKSCLSSLDIENGAVRAAVVNGSQELPTDAVFLCLGHSARDSIAMLYERGLRLEQKQFSMGLRIEHRQEDIDRIQYGKTSKELGLWPSDYKLNVRTDEGRRGVYTFCMCPGGYVVASSSSEGLLVTNGMSNKSRAGENANSAVLVDVLTSDFLSKHPLAGVEFQERYEALAFKLGGGNYCAPVQNVGDFMCRRSSTGPLAGGVEPTYKPGVLWTDLSLCLPEFVASSIREAIPLFERRLRGFANPKAVLTAIESRSSSPVRIKRDASLGVAVTECGSFIDGLYPCGEGAGYAGGIMSAAQDGIHMAEAFARSRL